MAGGSKPIDLQATIIGRDCEGVGEPVPPPAWPKGKAAKPILYETDAALELANQRIEASNRCQGFQRETLAAPVKPSK